MALPPNWTRYNTDEGKEYFHNAVTNTTQWDTPAWPDDAAAGGADSAMADVFMYQPSAAELESPSVAANLANLASGGGGGSGGPGGAGPTPQALGSPAVGGQGAAAALGFDNELVSLSAAPSGRIASASPPGGGGGAAGGASGGDLFSGLGLSGILGGSDGGAAAGGGAGGEELGGLQGWLLGQARHLFDVSTDDVVQRLKLVLLPKIAPSGQAKEELKARPDFYGPFWVATTAILFLAATGNFARLIETGDHTAFKADYSLVSLAAGTIYGCLLGVPLIARGSAFISGEEAGAIDFKQLVCVSGYSLAPAIPVSMLCLIPVGILRWAAVVVGLAISLIFVRGYLLMDITATAPWLKYTMTVGPCVMPVVVFFMYRVHFFTATP